MSAPRTGGTGRAYPDTRHSVIAALAAGDPAVRERALGLLAAAYWKPLYVTLRLRHRLPPEEAEDLVQEFFARALEKGWLDRYDPARGRFRTWLRTCLDGVVGHEREAASRLKRGGGLAPVPLDLPEVEATLAAGGDAGDRFDREWARAVLDLAFGALERRCRDEGKEVRYEVFRRVDVDGTADDRRPTYAEVAAALDIPATQVTNHLHWARREFRREVLATLRALTASEAEYRAEARALLGGDAA